MAPGTIYIAGYDAFMKFVEGIKDNETVNMYFSGSKDERGSSWCPDCVRAEPVVKEAVAKYASDDAKFVYIDVGDRATWKDPKCPFRTNKNTYLSVIPTLLRWKSPQKLEGPQCENPDLLEMFFTED
ncbi:unnamed protein product [Hermetia illucens]|uniref:Thioredoxin domain-containing protein 17 n=1 Tax=Hermetia illucens TaxID=343691 RepID=A0A7R8V6E8_HERIL|nr:thioredoxin domain-containing protein 17-like [Hermetia illucens]CAD7092940.1 unnamed protein product [Hermetia illucens]